MLVNILSRKFNAEIFAQVRVNGQQIAIDLPGLYIGKYNGLMQVGAKATDYTGEAYSYINFAPFTDLNYQIIGDPTHVSPFPTDIPTLLNALDNVDELLKWQSRYISLSNISFATPNVPLASYRETNILLIHDASGNQLEVKTSGYSTFFSALTPVGTGTISGILSYYNGHWQLMLNSLSDLGRFN